MRNEQEGTEQMRQSAPPTGGSSAPRPQQQPARGMIGMPEMIALGVAAFLLLVTVGAYLFLLAPARARLEASGRERARLETRINSATQSARAGQSTQATIAEIVESLRSFEESGLASPRSESRMLVIEELNDLIRRNNLRISGGLSFTSVDPVAPNASTTTSAARARQNVFPETAISLAVEGSYQNLRRFIRAIETSRHFIVINSVELEGVTDTNVRGAPGAPRGTLVSLRLEMSAYYRRAGDAPATAGTE